MASTINSTDTGQGGLITTGDSSDELQLQTAETTAVTITSGQQSAFIAGTAAAPAVTTTGDLNTGIFFPAGDAVGVATNGAEAARFNSSGNLVFPNGQGIDFSASAGGGATSSILDDYEEGTWTATLKGSIADPTTPVTSTARYTKIGDMVSLFIGYDNVNTTGASGNITVIGVPFASGVRTVGSINSYSLATFSGGYLSADIESTGTVIYALNVQSAATWGLATHNAGAGRYMFIAISYTV